MKLFIAEVMHSDQAHAARHYYKHAGVKEIKNPLARMHHCQDLMRILVKYIPKNAPLYGKETAAMMKARWQKLVEDFYSEETGRFDVTKIPDIFDYITYDAIYNQEALQVSARTGGSTGQSP